MRNLVLRAISGGLVRVPLKSSVEPVVHDLSQGFLRDKFGFKDGQYHCGHAPIEVDVSLLRVLKSKSLAMSWEKCSGGCGEPLNRLAMGVA